MTEYYLTFKEREALVFCCLLLDFTRQALFALLAPLVEQHWSKVTLF